MTSDDLTLEQCQNFLSDAEKHAKYFENVYNRMTTIGFGPKDDLLKSVKASRDEVLKLVYQLRGLVGKKSPPKPEITYPPFTAEELDLHKRVAETIENLKPRSRRRR